MLKNVTQIASGGWHNSVLTGDKKVYTWGYGADGQLGTGTVSNYSFPQEVLDYGSEEENVIGNVLQIGVSERSTFVVTNKGEVFAVGENSNYQLSQNNNTDLNTIEKLLSQDGENYINNIINVPKSCANTNNTAVITKDGNVWVSGLGAFGQVGNGEYETATVYTRMGRAGLSLKENIITLAEKETHKLNVNVKTGFNVYEDYTDSAKNLTYKTANENIAKVNINGVIEAVAQGRTRIIIEDKENLWVTSTIVEITRDTEDKVKAKIESGGAGVLLKTDGTVWTFGDNTYGERGIGDTNSYVDETQVVDVNGTDKLTNIINVSSGQYFMAAVKEDGRVVTWGRGNLGQLGNGQNINANKPVYVIDSEGNELTDVIKVSCGLEFAIALKSDGTVWAFGTNGYGQLGNGTTTASNVARQVKDSTGKGYLLNICDITSQGFVGVALSHSGEVYSWGYGTDGQLGNGTKTKTNTLPRKVAITDVAQIVGGYHHTMALKTDGTVWTWGLNRYGSLGIGASSTSSSSGNYCKTTPVQVKLNSTDMLEDVVDIGTAYEASFARTKAGEVYSWGYNNSGQLGTNNTSNYNIPQSLKKMYGEDFTDKVVALNRGCSASTNYFIREDGTVLGNGYTNTQSRLITKRTANVLTVTELKQDFLEIDKRAVSIKQGESISLNAQIRERLNAFTGHIKLGNLTWESSNEKVVSVSNNGIVTAVSLGEATITVRDESHGYQAQSIIYVIQNEEKAVAMPDISQGSDFTVILKADGSVWATGLNNNGQLGDGTTTNRSVPVRVKISSKEYLSNIVKISAGQDHVVALSKEGEVYAWGLNDVGQLGNGTTTRMVYATKVLSENADDVLKGIIDVSAGYKFSLALLQDGTVYGFGRNTHGELGILNNANKLLPTQMDSIVNAVKVGANSAGSVVQLGNGTVWTSGYNYYGTLGQNGINTGSTAASQGRNVANPVINNTRNGVLKNVIKTVSGLHQNIVLTKDKEALVFGYNNVGQLGTGNVANYAYPEFMKVLETGEILSDEVVDIGASGYNTIVKTKSQDEKEHVLITGYNNYGQVGNNSTTNVTSLIPVYSEDNLYEKEGLDILPDDSRALSNTGYIDENGNVWTVGANNYGQIGDDTLYQRKNIVQIGEIALKVKENIFTMKQNETKQIEAYLEDSFNVYIKDIEAGTLKFEVIDKDIASVSQTGLVTAVGIGSTLIKVVDETRNIQTAVIVKVIKDQEDVKYEPMVVGGANHSVALKADGTVWAWGYNKFGQLGNNTTVTTEIPTEVKGKDGIGTLNNIQMIASGTNHVLALSEDGTVWAWGYNNYGQLGDNTQISRYTPVKVLSEDGESYLKDIIYIAAGSNFSVAVNKAGEVWSFGQNDYGQLGDGTKISRYTPVKAKANLTGIINVACGFRHTVALKADGTVWTWGDNTYGQLGDNTKGQKLVPVKVLENTLEYVEDATGISANYYTTNILREDKTILSVGLGTSGELGDNTKVSKQLPVQVKDSLGENKLSDIIQIKSGANTTYALSKTGKVYSWGLGTSGELGNCADITSSLPVVVKNSAEGEELNGSLYIGAGANIGFAVENNGYVKVWGKNNQKQLGDSTIAKSNYAVYINSKIITKPQNVNLEVNETKQIEITMDSFNLFKSEETNKREVIFKSLNEKVATVSNSGVITGKTLGITKIVITDVLTGKLSTVNVSVLENGAIASPKVASGLNHTVALKSDGTVWTWGLNNHGQLGIGSTTNSYIPTKVDLTDVIDVAAGDYFSLALRKDGTVWAWGYNDAGQLGQANTYEVLTPMQVLGVNGRGYLTGVIKISACRHQWAAILDTTEVVGCGWNQYGVLGDNTSTNRTTPVYMVNYNGVGNVKNVKDISVGQCDTFIVKEDGSVWGTGHNCNGALGLGSKSTVYKIHQVKDSTGKGVLTDIIQISTSGWYFLALDINGNIWSVGNNDKGELGQGNTTDMTRPKQVVGVGNKGVLENIVSISAGYYSSFAIDKDGNAYSWGYNNYGQLGLNNTSTYTSPRQVLDETGIEILSNVMLVSSNGYHTTFATDDGRVWTVGYNVNGELGNDSNITARKIECISIPSLETSEKYLTFENVGETKKISITANPGFNLLTNTLKAENNKFESLDENIAIVDENGIITAKGIGETYIKVKNEALGLMTAVKVVVNVREGETWPKIAGGANHYVALKADGTVWTWGLNNCGQLGIGNTQNCLEPTFTNQSEVIDVASGANFTALLKKDGTVWVSGQNNYGQLGQNDTENKLSFVQVKSENGLDILKDIVSISANNYYMAALKKDGTVYAWGYNKYGNLGDNSNSNKKLPSKVRKVANIMQISAGANHLVLLDADGTVWATGYNGYGGLAQNNKVNKNVPVKMLDETGKNQISDIVKVQAGVHYTLLLNKEGKVFTVGYNYYGNLAQGNKIDKLLPVAAKDSSKSVITDAKDINARQYISAIIRKDGSIWTVGYNAYGSAANGTTVLNTFYNKVLGEYGKYEFENGILVGNTNNTIAVADNAGKVYTAGYNGYGQLGDNTKTTSKYLVGISHTSLKVKEPIVILNTIGETKEIKVNLDLGFNILYNNLENENYIYKSLNPNIATVNNSGIITAVKYGNARIEVTNEETGNKAIVIVKIVREGDIANPKVESGRDFTVALKSDGTVWSWGYNPYGNLGTGDKTLRKEPTKIDIDNVVDIACGNYHVLFLKADGTVWSVGLNNYGQLGNNTTTNALVPVQVQGLTDIIRIDAGANHSIALKSNGTVWSFGYNSYGQLGDGTTVRRNAPVKVSRIEGISEISAGNHSTFAIDIEGNVYAWGLNTSGQLGLGTKANALVPTKIENITNALQISTGLNYSVVVTNKGEVYSFGVNNYGQLGIGNKTNKNIPVKVVNSDNTPLSNIEYVSAGVYHVIAKTNDGRAYGWGIDNNYQFGDEITTQKLYPAQIKYNPSSDEFTNVLDISAGNTHSVIVKTNGTVWTAGKNNYGQIGDNTNITRKSWVCISDTQIKVKEQSITINKIGGTYELKPKVDVGFNLLYNTMQDAEYKYRSKNTAIAEVNSEGVIKGNKRGKTRVEITETNSEETIYVDIYVLDEKDVAFPQIAVNQYSTIALKSNGTVWTWGQNANGELGLGDTNNRIAPTKVDIDNVVKITVSSNHVLALKEDGTVWAWGANTYGQLGQGNTTKSLVPVKVKDETGTGFLNNIKEINTANNMSLALDKDGNVYTWGLNNVGQLGIGTKANKNLPVQIETISNIAKIEGGNRSNYAISKEGKVYSWGYNNYGQLGDGTKATRVAPVEIPNLSNIVEISASTTEQVLALKSDGTVWGFGYSNLGALTDVGGAIPKQIKGINDQRMEEIIDISSGYYAGLSITEEGKVLAWGTNGYGGLGNGIEKNTANPTYVLETSEKEISNIFIAEMGRNYSIFAKENGEVWATGYNELGSLGNDSKANISIAENISNDYISTDCLELVFNNINETKKINAKYSIGFNLYYDENTTGINYESHDESIAVVNNEGNVIAKGIGKTYIDIKSEGLARRIEVNVLKQDEICVMDAKAGNKHTIGLKTNGSIWGFGDNSYGQLGQGQISNKAYDEPKEIKEIPEGVKFTKIAVGNNHTLVLDTKGNVYSFGQNNYGQLGNNTTTNSGTVSKIQGLQNIVKIVAYENISMAINNNGIAYVWGQGYGKVPKEMNYYFKVIDISGKIVLLENGTIWDMANANQKVPSIINAVEIASGNAHNIALDANGEVYTWGNNSYGNLGTGDTVSSNTPVRVQNVPKAESVKAGQYNSYILAESKEVYSFGRNSNNSLGLNLSEETYKMTPTKINSQNVQRISAGQNYGVYVADDGFVYSWGLNNVGQLGHGDKEERTYPTLIGRVKIITENEFVTVKIGEEHKLNATLNNTFNLRQDVIDTQGFTFTEVNPNIASINNGNVLGKENGITTIIVKHEVSEKTANIFVEVLLENAKSVIDVKASKDFTIALKADGSVWGFGLNTSGGLALKDNNNYNEPQKIELDFEARQIAVGNAHTVILSKDGSVFTSGLNNAGQLGNGTKSNSNTLVKVLDENGKVIEDIAYITAKGDTTYLLDFEGNVYAFGSGYNKVATKIEDIEEIAQISGRYGITAKGKVIDLSKKEIIQGLENIAKISEGANHTLFLTKEKIAYTIGTNANGQCGIGTKVNVITPAIVKNTTGTSNLSGIKDIEAGDNFSIAVLENGDVYTWGSNESNKLGIEQTSDVVLPRKVSNISDGIMVDAGANHAVYVANSGKVYAWGAGENGTLGNSVNMTSSVPVQVGEEEIIVNTNHLTLRKGEKAKLEAFVKSFNLINDLEQTGMSYTSNDRNVIKVDEISGEVTGIDEGKTSIIVEQEGTNNISIIQVDVIKQSAEVKPNVYTVNSTQLILKADGTVWSYGVNTNGELGIKNAQDSDVLRKVEFEEGTKIIEIAVGEKHVLALDSEGIVWAWGANNYYQLGNSINSNSLSPIKVNLEEKIVKIGAGYNSSFAITEDNRLISWGLNTNGELGLGNYENRLLPTKVQTMKNVLDIKAGKSHTVLLDTKGNVWTVGNNSFGSLSGEEYRRNTFNKVDELAEIAYISAGEYHNLALGTTRKLYAWGHNAYGQLGTGDENTVLTPMQITNVSYIKEISAGKANSMVVTKNGEIYVTGINSLGQFGNGTKNNSKEFTLIDKINSVYTGTIGNTYSMAIKNDGTVWGFGDYYHGITDVLTSTNSTIPVQIGKQSFSLKENDISVNKSGTKELEINKQFEFNVFDDKNISNNYTYSSLNTDIVDVDQKGMITGKNIGTTWIKVIENDTKEERIAIVRVIEEENKVAPKVVGGKNHTVVLKADGSIYSFGYNSNGELANGSYALANVPKEINILKSYKNISAGENFTLILRDDGTIWSAGDNTYGQLGLGDRTSYNAPKVIKSLNSVIKISAGAKHSVALTKDGEVYTWGANKNGQLAINSNITKDEPTKIYIPNSNIVDVSAGKNYTVLVDNTGKVYISGVGFGIESKEMTILEGIEDAVKVVAGEELLVLTKDGNVVKVGDSSLVVYSLGNAVDIDAKDGNYMILSNSGKLYVFGENANGELGVQNTSNVNVPTLINTDKKVIRIGSGNNNTYYITEDGLVYSAGLNTYGALGNNTNETSDIYTLVGSREFTVTPDNIIMNVNDIVDLKIESERFNVFKQDLRDINDFEWETSDEEIVTVEETAKIKGVKEGEAILKVKQSDTGSEKEITVIVMPLDAQRIDKLSVNEVEAKVSGMFKYEVVVITDENTGELVVKTKDETDKISIDNGNTWTEDGNLIVDVSLIQKETEILIKVKTSNETEFEYTLKVIKQSDDAELKELKVNGIEVASVGSLEYSVILEDTDLANVNAVTLNEFAKISIDNEVDNIHEYTKDISMENTLIKIVPIKVTAESGKEVTYILTIYKKSAITELESLTVDGKEAVKDNFINYSIIVEKDVTEVEIKATTLYDTAKVNINDLGEEEKTTTRKITLTGDETKVKIAVSAEGLKKEYVLTITRKPDTLGIAFIYVNGKEVEKTSENIYEAYVASNSESAEVLVVASVNTSLVQIGNIDAEVGRQKVQVDTCETVNTYTIIVTDSENAQNTETYTLVIKKASTDNLLKEITIANYENETKAVRLQGTNVYKAKLSEKYTQLLIKAKANNDLAEVAIDENSYKIKEDSKEIGFNVDTIQIPIKVKAQNGEEAEYTLILERLSNNANLEYVKVNDAEATLSTELKDTYEITLTSKETEVIVNAKTESEFAEVAINNVVYEKQEITKIVQMDSKDIIAKINVKAEDETVQVYDLIIHSLPDNTNLNEILVNEIKAEQVPYSNTYRVRVPSSLTNYEVKVTAEDSLANVKINEFEEQKGVSLQTVLKDTSKENTTVRISIKAQDEDAVEDYMLEIIPMSANTELSYVKVDGSIIDKAEDGEYHVKVINSKTEVDIETLVESVFAKVGIDEEGTGKLATKIGTLTGDKTVFDIKVTAEDGTVQTYKLNIEKMSNNTDVSIYIDDVLVTKVDGKYTLKIGNNTKAEIKAITADETAVVSIDSNVDTLHENTENIFVTEEEKTVLILVTAEDGTTEIHSLVLQRYSSDNTLLEILAEGIEEDKIVQTSETGYQMIVSRELTKLNLTAIATKEVSKVKISDNSYELHQTTKEIVVPNETNNITIRVQAENGEEKEYILTIIKKYELTLDSVLVDNEEIEEENGEYTAWIDTDAENAKVIITPTSKDVIVKVENITENVGGASFTVQTPNEETNVKVTLVSPLGDDEVEYILKIMKKSANMELEYVKVDEQIGVLEEDTYTVKVPIKTEKYIMQVKTESPYASVKIEANEYKNEVDTYEVDLTDAKSKILMVTVKAQNGEEKAYTVIIEKVSDDASIKTLTVGGVQITEENGEYKAFVKESITETQLYIETTHDKASIKIENDEEKIHTVTNKVVMDLEERTLNIIITAEDGTVKIYTVVIAKESSDTGIQRVRVDGKDAILTNENTYYITASAGAEEVEINVIAANQNAKVQINGSEKLAGENTIKYTLPKDTKIAEVPIIITAQNGTDTKEYILQIEQVSNNTEIEIVKVNDETVTEYDEETKTYKMIVGTDVDEAEVYIKTADENASVRIDTGDLSKHEGTQTVSTASEENIIVVTVIAEDGTTETRGLIIKKLSKDASIIKLFVNDEEIEQTEDGTYTAEVLESIKTSKVRIKTTNENAEITINNIKNENKGDATQEIDTSTQRKLVVPIKVVAEDTSVVNNTTLTINVVSDVKDLEYVKINGIDIEDKNYDESIHTYKSFIPEDSTSALINVKAKSPYATLRIDSVESPKEMTYTVQTDEDITYVYVDVIAENDSVRSYTIILQKTSTDSTLKELYKDGVYVDAQEDGNYIINVLEFTEELTLKAVANNKYAKVEIGDNEAEDEQSEKKVILSEEKVTIVPITVTSQSGSVNTYTVTINKVSTNNEIEYVKVNSEAITNYDVLTKTYTEFIPSDSEDAEIEVKAKSEYATVENGDTVGTQIIKFVVLAEAEETMLEVIVTNENGNSESYYIKLMKISTDNTLKEILVNDIEAKEQEEGGYIAEVLETATEVAVRVVANNKYATVQINDYEKELSENTKTVQLSKERLTTVIITITSQSGETKTETLTIKKVSDDASINTVLVNDIECTNYDEETKTYTAYINENDEEAKVSLLASSSYAKVSIGTENIGTGVVTTNIDTKENVTKIPLTVKSETGKVERYWINIIKKSTDASIEVIKVNDVVIDVPYEVEIKKLDTKAKIYVKAISDKAMVKIGDEEAEISEAVVRINLSLEQDEIIVPVVITAQNGTEKKTYNITLKRTSNNSGLKEVIVNGEMVNLDTLEYVVKNTNTSDIKVTTIDETAKVSIDNKKPTVNVATSSVDTKLTTIRTITVIAEDGTIKEYSLTLIKKVTIEGKITDAFVGDEHFGMLTVYQTSDTRDEKDNINPREVISKCQTNADGTYQILLEPGVYDVLFTKPGYLSHRITNIDITDGLGAILNTVDLLGGDIDGSDQIEIDDLVEMNDNFGKEAEGLEEFDLNGDGRIDKQDRNILKGNYGKLAQTIKWINPNMEIKGNEEIQETILEDDKDTQDFILPMSSKYVITSEYGTRIDPITGEESTHNGIDISGEWHTEILAVAGGEITYAGVQNGYGNCIEVKHEVNGEVIYSFYAHLSEIKVELGELVSQGQIIGLEGGAKTDPNHGASTGHHLHFEIRKASGSKNCLEPRNYIKF